MQHIEPLPILLGGEKQRDDADLIQSIDDDRADNSAFELVPPGYLESGNGSKQQEQGFSSFTAIEYRQRSVRRNDSVPVGLGICIRRDEVDGGCTGQHCSDIEYYMFNNGALPCRIAVLQHKEEQQEYQRKAQFLKVQEGVSCLLQTCFGRLVQRHGLRIWCRKNGYPKKPNQSE